MAEDSSEELPPIVSERRGGARKRSFFGGLAVSRDGARTVPCTIHNISDSGARVKVGKDQVIGEHTFLIVNGRKIVYEASATWTRAHEYGFKFLKTHTLESLTTPELRFLRRHVVERLARTDAA